MMFDEGNISRDGVFPYTWPRGLNPGFSVDGPVGSDLAALYIGAIFHDIANEAGLGVHKADLLIWKTISLISNNVTFPMRAFGAKVQQAARALWPDSRPGRASKSLYEEDINDVLYVELTDRDFGNLVLFAPNRTIRWLRSRQRCPNQAAGFYAEDVQPFGFRVIQATPNGFSFTASTVSETSSNKTYQLTIVDPSVATLGPGNYAWNFTNYLGAIETATGSIAQYTALKDQPFTLSIIRTRGGETNTLTLRERGNDLERNGGNAFVRNLVP